MKKILFVVIMTGVFFDLFGQKNGPEGKIKSMVVYEQNLKKGKTKAVKELEVNYDVKGNAIEEIEYKDEKVFKKTTCLYDASNNKIKETELNSLGNVIKVVDYKYSGGRRLEKIIYGEDNKVKSKKTYQYVMY